MPTSLFLLLPLNRSSWALVVRKVVQTNHCSSPSKISSHPLSLCRIMNIIKSVTFLCNKLHYKFLQVIARYIYGSLTIKRTFALRFMASSSISCIFHDRFQKLRRTVKTRSDVSTYCFVAIVKCSQFGEIIDTLWKFLFVIFVSASLSLFSSPW